MRKTVLENGITILTKNIPSSHAVSLGFWVKAGSIHENKSQSGCAHFLEHMIFKGTKKRSARQIANEIDTAGAYINAGTAKEYTSYYISIIHDKIDLALDILTDIIENSVFAPIEIRKERQVVLEEIKMYEDSPAELVQDNLIESMLQGHPIGHSILGKREIIENISRKKLISFFKAYYHPGNIVISAAGRISHDRIIDYISKKKFFKRKVSSGKAPSVEDKIKPKSTIVSKDLAQVHFCLGFPGIPISDKSRYALYVFNSMFGASMSSRLFQNIREAMGLCYSIYSFNSMYKDLGVFGVYAGTGVNSFQRALNEVLKEIGKIKKGKMSKKEVFGAKEHLKGNMALAYENIDAHMNSMARQEIYYNKQILFKKQIKAIDMVSLDDVHNIAQRIFPDDYKIIVSSIGHKDHKKILNKTDLAL